MGVRSNAVHPVGMGENVLVSVINAPVRISKTPRSLEKEGLGLHGILQRMPKYSSRWPTLAVAAAALTACTHGSAAHRPHDSLVIGRLGDFQSLNPLLISG